MREYLEQLKMKLSNFVKWPKSNNVKIWQNYDILGYKGLKSNLSPLKGSRNIGRGFK